MSDTIRSDLGPFAIMPRWIFADPTIDGKALRVLGYLASYADRDGTHCWPAQQLIARDLAVSVDTVQRAISRLSEHGLVEVTPRLVKGRKVGNDYLIRYLSESRKSAVSDTSPKAAEPGPTEAAPAAVSYDQTKDQTSVDQLDESREGSADDASDEELMFREIIEQIVDRRVAGQQPRNVAAYRQAVRGELTGTVGDRLRRVIASHPGAPIEMYAAFAAGEPTPYLGAYRKEA